MFDVIKKSTPEYKEAQIYYDWTNHEILNNSSTLLANIVYSCQIKKDRK